MKFTTFLLRRRFLTNAMEPTKTPHPLWENKMLIQNKFPKDELVEYKSTYLKCNFFCPHFLYFFWWVILWPASYHPLADLLTACSLSTVLCLNPYEFSSQNYNLCVTQNKNVLRWEIFGQIHIFGHIHSVIFIRSYSFGHLDSVILIRSSENSSKRPLCSI